MVDYSKIHAEYLGIQEAKDLVDKYTTISDKLVDLVELLDETELPVRFVNSMEDFNNWLLIQAFVARESYSE